MTLPEKSDKVPERNDKNEGQEDRLAGFRAEETRFGTPLAGLWGGGEGSDSKPNENQLHSLEQQQQQEQQEGVGEEKPKETKSETSTKITKTTKPKVVKPKASKKSKDDKGSAPIPPLAQTLPPTEPHEVATPEDTSLENIASFKKMVKDLEREVRYGKSEEQIKQEIKEREDYISKVLNDMDEYIRICNIQKKFPPDRFFSFRDSFIRIKICIMENKVSLEEDEKRWESYISGNEISKLVEVGIKEFAEETNVDQKKLELALVSLKSTLKEAKNIKHSSIRTLEDNFLSFSRVSSTIKGHTDNATELDYKRVKEFENETGDLYSIVKEFDKLREKTKQELSNISKEEVVATYTKIRDFIELKGIEKTSQKTKDFNKSLYRIIKSLHRKVMPNPNDLVKWREYQSKQGSVYKEVTEKKEAPILKESEPIPSSATIPKIQELIKQLNTACENVKGTDPRYREIETYSFAYNRILSRLEGSEKYIVSKEQIALWNEYETGLDKKEGKIFDLLKLADKEKKVEAKVEKKKLDEWEDFFDRMKKGEVNDDERNEKKKMIENAKEYFAYVKERDQDGLEKQAHEENERFCNNLIHCIENNEIPEQKDIKRLSYVDPGIFTELVRSQLNTGAPTSTPPPLPSTPPPLPAELLKFNQYDPEIAKRMIRIGVTAEMLASIPEFKEIAQSEGKVAWVLEKLESIKLRNIENDAKEEFEKQYRASNFFVKIIRAPQRKTYTSEIATELGKKEFSFERHAADLENVIHLANAAPDMTLEKKNEEFIVVSEYLKDIPGIEQGKLDGFNEAASAYSAIPPEREWAKLAPKQVKEYEIIKANFEKEKSALLDNIPEHFNSLPDGKIHNYKKYSDIDAMRIVHNAVSSVKIHQDLNNYPNAEIILKRLAESNGFNKKWDGLKAQLGIGGASGGFGFAAGMIAGSFGTRWTAKSLLAGVTSAWALPATIAIIGGTFGAIRGGVKGKKRLAEEEELMRLGFEEQTHSRKLLPKLNEKFEERRKLSDRLNEEKKGKNNPKTIEKLEKQMKKINEKIDSLRGTDQNFIKAGTQEFKSKDENGKEIDAVKLGAADKINQLTNLLGMEYLEYIKTPQGTDRSRNPISPEEFNERKKDWAEKLDVRLSYTQQKLDEGKMSFGKEAGSLAQRLKLYEAMGSATAKLLTLPPEEQYDQPKVFRQHTPRETTRRSALTSMLANAEKIIEKNQKTYIRYQKVIGAITGGVLGGAGTVGGMWAGGFVRESLNVFQEKINLLKGVNFSEGRSVEKVVTKQLEERLADASFGGMLARDAAKSSIDNPNAALFGRGLAPTEKSIVSNFFNKNATLNIESKVVPNVVPVVPEPEIVKIPNIPKNFIEGEPHIYKVTADHQGREHALVDYFKKVHHSNLMGSQAEINKRLGAGWEEKYFSKNVWKGDEFRIEEKNGVLKIERYRNGKLFERLIEEKEGGLKKLPLTSFTEEKIVTTAETASQTPPQTVLNTASNVAPSIEPNTPPEISVETPSPAPAVASAPITPRVDIIPDKMETVETVQIDQTPSLQRPQVYMNGVETAPTLTEVSDIISPREVKGSREIISYVSESFSAEPRFAKLSDGNKDKFIFKLISNLIEKSKENENPAGFYRNMGIKSMNIFDIQGGDNIDLSKAMKEETINGIFTDIDSGKVPDSVIGLRGNLGKLTETFKGVIAEELTPEDIIEELKKIKQ